MTILLFETFDDLETSFKFLYFEALKFGIFNTFDVDIVHAKVVVLNLFITLYIINFNL